MTHNFEEDGVMAYFARLNELNAIDQIFVLNKEDILDSEGIEQEALGLAICKQEFGGENWMRISNQPELHGGMPGYWWTYDPIANTFSAPAEPEVTE